MVVVVLSNCPPALRGDLTLWLQEIATGVYVGHVSARVREQLWIRITENIKTGQATLVFSADNEQGHQIYVHGTTWKVVDLEGLEVVFKPSSQFIPDTEIDFQAKRGSKVSRRRKAQQTSRIRRKMIEIPDQYVVLDIETTGTDPGKDSIIEIACIRVKDENIIAQYTELINPGRQVPAFIQKLTGIDDALMVEKGKPSTEVIPNVFDFIRDNPVVAHNVGFDLAFIKTTCQKIGLTCPIFKFIDTLELSRRLVSGVQNYQLRTLAEHFGIAVKETHRALADCKITMQLFKNLTKTIDGT